MEIHEPAKGILVVGDAVPVQVVAHGVELRQSANVNQPVVVVIVVGGGVAGNRNPVGFVASGGLGGSDQDIDVPDAAGVAEGNGVGTGRAEGMANDASTGHCNAKGGPRRGKFHRNCYAFVGAGNRDGVRLHGWAKPRGRRSTVLEVIPVAVRAGNGQGAQGVGRPFPVHNDGVGHRRA